MVGKILVKGNGLEGKVGIQRQRYDIFREMVVEMRCRRRRKDLSTSKKKQRRRRRVVSEVRVPFKLYG